MDHIAATLARDELYHARDELCGRIKISAINSPQTIHCLRYYTAPGTLIAAGKLSCLGKDKRK